MEPFELALSQVNFEGNDLNAGPGGGVPLHSFSNLVSYDSDFKDGAGGRPVSAHRLPSNTEGKAAPEVLAASFYMPYAGAHNGGPHAHAHLYNGSDSVTVEPDETARLFYGAEVMEDSSSSSGGTPKRRKEKVTDSFTGFTETVEALALQKSVIGNSNIIPASADEVARVIAMTQRKMKEGDSETESNGSRENTSTIAVEYTESPVDTTYQTHASTSSHVECSPAATMSAASANAVPELDGLVPGSHGVHVASAAAMITDVGPSEHYEEPDAAAAASREDGASTISSSSHQRTASTSSSELIPIPPDMITKVTERKGWLAGRSVVSPEQSRPRASNEGSVNRFATSDTAEKDYVCSPAGSASEQLHAQQPQAAQSEPVIGITEQGVLNDSRTRGQEAEDDIARGADISGVEKLKGEYDFDTSSYLETMQTFTSLQKTNNMMLGEETGTARFSPPVKDPGMLHTDRRSAHSNKNSKTDRHAAHVDKDHESLRILPDENLILPFHVPVDTSTPVRPINGQGDGSHRKDLKARSAKRQVILEETSQRRETYTTVSKETINITSQDRRIKPSSSKQNSALEHIDQDITDGTNGVNELLPEQLTAMKVAHNISRVQHETLENSSMVVNVDDTSQDKGRVDDMMGDLSMGNSSTAAGDGADLNKSERAELYRLQEEVERLRRDKAHLEGKLEVLGEEAGTAIKERSELQSHLASVSTHLKSQENSNKSVTGDRNALAADLDTLKQNRQRLELVVMDAQKLIEEKDQDLKTLHEDLMLAHAANERSQENVKAHRHELMARDETIQALKNKVAELYVAYQNSQQAGLLANNQIKSLESSAASLTSAKEWYQGQLARVQDAKGELQQEITRIQGEGITALTLVERLKADNVRIKQALAEQQQRALQEKEMLAKHLEAIESDMMEREAAFSQLQQDQVAMESAMKQEEERLRQSENEGSSSEDLKKLQNELRRKQAQVNVLEHEQTQLVKRLTLSQESLLERDRTIDRLDQKYVEIELSYKNLQREVDGRDEEVLKLKNEKSALEVELASTQEEKKTFDTALHVIKDDMGRVEQGFRQLKQELAGRTEELDQARGQNQELHRQLAAARARLRVLTHQPSPQHVTQEQDVATSYDLAPVHKDSPESEEGLVVRIVQKENEVGDIQPEVVIETQVCEMLGSANDAKDSIAELDNAVIERLQAQRDELEKRLQESQAQVEDLREAAGAGKQFSSQIAELTQRLGEAERQYKAATEERALTEQHLVQSKEHLVEMELVIRKLTEEKEVLEQTLGEERARLEGETANAMSDAVEEREAIGQLNKENAMLRSKVTETEKQMTKEIAKLRGKVLQVTEEYEARLDEERSRQLDYQAALSELNQRTRHAEELKEQLAEQLRASEERFNLSLDEQKLQLQEQTQKLGQERGTLEAAERAVRVELEDVHALLQVREETIEILRTKICEIEVQHREAREQLEESERLRQEEDARRLNLDLEREKGRLAGVVQSHTALKEHTTSLEAALARREASVAGLSTHVQGELQKRDKQVHDLREQLKELEAELIKEKQNVKDIKKQLMTEKGQHIKLRRQMETLWVDQDQVKVDLQTRTNQLNLTILDLEKAKQTNMTLKAEVERLGRESYTMRAQLEELKRDMLEREQQDPLLKEQIQTLEWQLQQRTLEVDSLKDQLQLGGERQALEVENLNKALQAANAELASVKEEMAALRQEKLALTTKVAQIKSALKATTTHNKKRREQKEAELTKTLPFDMTALERLLADTAPVSVQSKPLSFLKATLSGLRGEISNLQHQVDQHTSAVQTSSQAWKALEGHVQELREVCKTSAAGRAAAHSGLPVEDNVEAALPETRQSAPEPAPPTPQARTNKTQIVDV